ncbi:hypothetical protein [Kitasatospora sp. NPDC050463]|uniref:hypothetical protein n=1 Tax=Kitasatospora sp. NPDC050463 TaxID=3155786 RepID=UPI0033D76140
MSLSRLGLPSSDPAAPRRRFGRRRGAVAALPAGPGTPGPAAPAPAVAAPSAAAPAAAPAVVRSELRPVGPHFVIAPSTAGDDELSAAVGTLRPVPGSIVVVAAAPDSAPVLRDRMADLGVIARSRGAATLVLAASGLAALAPNGRRPAEVVADRAGLPVIAPDGLVEITPDGNLKVTAPDGVAEAAAWWHCAPGTAPRRVRETIGATAPIEPASTALAVSPAGLPGHLPAESPAAPRHRPAVHVLRLPAGFWLTHPSAPPAGPLPGLGLAGAPPGTVVLVVGTPALPVLLPEDFAEAVVGLPVDTARLLVSAPWAAPDELAALTGALSARLARPVNAAIGLPVLGPGGPTSRILDAHGQARWEPYLLRLAAAPGQGTAPAAWRNGGASWRTGGPGVFEAFPYWALEAVPAGLWLRPEPPHVLTPRFRRPEAARPLLIVGERDRPVEADVFEELGRLLDLLPSSGTEGFGLLVHGLLEPATERIARFIARMHDLDWLGPEQPAGSVPGVAAVSYGIGGLPGARPGVGAVPQSAPAAVAAPQVAQPPALSGPLAVPSAVAVPTASTVSTGAAPPGTGPLGADPADPSATAPSVATPEPDPSTGPSTAPAPEPMADPGADPLAAASPGPFPGPFPGPVGPPTRTATSGGPGGLGFPAPVASAPNGAASHAGAPASGAGPASAAAPTAAETDPRPGPAGEPTTVPAADPHTGAAPEPPVEEPAFTWPAPHTSPTTESLASASGEEPGEEPGGEPGEEPGGDLGGSLSGDQGGYPGRGPGEEPDAEPVEHRAEEPEGAPASAPVQARPLRPENCPVPVAVSGADDRDAVRTLLGEHYHRCSGRIDQVTTRLPGLRSTSKDDIKPDLAAVLLHHGDAGVPVGRAELIAAARSCDPELAPFLRCLGSGLRRLPSHHGAVLLCAPPGPDPAALLAHYPVGQQLTEPAPVTGLTASAIELPGAAVEFVVWSATGRRTSAFGSGTEELRVTFAPGTTFTVVAVVPADPADPSGRPARVLLRESAGAIGADPAERDRSALTRLRSWLDRRDRLGPAERRRIEEPERFHLTPGVELLASPDGA